MAMDQQYLAPDSSWTIANVEIDICIHMYKWINTNYIVFVAISGRRCIWDITDITFSGYG